MILHFIAIAALILAVGTGLRTIHRHRLFFEAFELRDLIGVRLDAVLYTLNLVSTAFCFGDAAVLSLSGLEGGWGSESTHWILPMIQIVIGTFSTVFHLTTDRLLESKEFCTLCRQRLPNLGRRDGKTN